MQYSVISTRITCLYGSQPLSVVFACKTAPFWAEYQISMGPRHDLSFCACETAWLASSLYGSQPASVVFACKTAPFWAEYQISMGPRHDLSFCACKTASLASELLVSMGPSPHVCFLDAKQRLLDRKNKSLWVPDITCRFVDAKQRDLQQNDKSIWVPALICDFFMQNSDFMTRLTSLYGSKTSSVVFACKTATYGPECESLCVPDFTCRFVHAKQRDLHQNDKLTWFTALICGFVHAKQRL